MKTCNAFLYAAMLALALMLVPGVSAHAIRIGGQHGSPGSGNAVQTGAQGSITNTYTGRSYSNLQQAVDGAGAGHTILLGAGDFFIDKELLIENKAGLTLQGAGPDKTRVLVTSTTTLVISASYSSKLTIRDIYLSHDVPPYDGPSCSAGVIQALDVSDLTVANAELVGSGLLGIWYFAFGENGSLGTLSITDTVIHDNQQSGLIIQGAAFDKLVLSNVRIADNGGYGMEVYADPQELARVQVQASRNVFAGNALGRMGGDMPAGFEKSIVQSLQKGVDTGRGGGGKQTGDGGRKPAPHTGDGGRKPAPGADESTAALAKKYEVSAAALQALIKENGRITVLPEYKDSPEMLAAKLKQLEYINEYRKDNGSGAIEFDIAVARLCNLHAYDQVLNDYMGHNSQDGSTPWDRAARYGIGIWAENIAMPGGVGTCDQMDAPAALEYMHYSSDMFMGEGPGGGHHDNMLNTQHTGVGFGLMCYDGRVMYVEEFR
jgi:uncharacterized protein YkwD